MPLRGLSLKSDTPIMGKEVRMPAAFRKLDCRSTGPRRFGNRRPPCHAEGADGNIRRARQRLSYCEAGNENLLNVHLPDWVYILVAALSMVVAIVLLIYALAPRT
jgi:hypothetical protein